MSYQSAGPNVNPILTGALLDEDDKPSVPGILKKYHAIMTEVGAIEKASTNSAQGFKFRGIDAFQNKLHQLLIKNRVIVTPQVTHRTDDIVEGANGKKQRAVNLVMKYTFTDVDDGSSLSIMMPSEGLDFGDKATNKALSFNLKYALIQGLMIPTEDMENPEMDIDEGDAVSPSLTTETKKETKKKDTTTNGTKSKRFERKKTVVAETSVAGDDDDDL